MWIKIDCEDDANIFEQELWEDSHAELFDRLVEEKTAVFLDVPDKYVSDSIELEFGYYQVSRLSVPPEPIKKLGFHVTCQLQGRDNLTRPVWVLNSVNIFNEIVSNTTKEVSMSGLIERNKSAALDAARITLGKAVLNKLSKKVKDYLPVGYKAKASDPFVQLVLANVFVFIADNYGLGGDKVSLLANTALDAAMHNIGDNFNVEGILDDLFEGIEIPKNLKN